MKSLDKYNNVVSNEPISIEKVEKAERIISGLQEDIRKFVKNGAGPFAAAIFDANGNELVKTCNSVVSENCSHNHAEVNAIKEVEKYLGTYDLSEYNLSLYVTAEPCIMCIGAIMWSGIKNVYYGVPSETVEKITGFDEGFKENWQEEFKKRGITVYGNIATELGERVLQEYLDTGCKVYMPNR